MAYRKLHDLDLVRVVNGGDHHGRDAVVLDAGELSSYIQIQGSNICFVINNTKLLVLDNPNQFIIDGRIDHEAKRKWIDDQQSRNYNFDVDDEEECEYDYWDRSDLIDRIKQLERELLHAENELSLHQL